MHPTARSLILDLLSTVRRGSVPVRALFSAGTLFGIAENSVRVALARLLADGLVARDERGRYRLGPRAAAVTRELSGWRDVEKRLRPWTGTWIGVLTTGLPRRRARAHETRARALRFLGFRALAPGLEVRPDNLAGGVGEARERLEVLGLDGDPPLFSLAELDPEADRRARSLWDADLLRRSYRETSARLAASAARLRALPRREAMAESFLLGGDAIRQIVLDPLLPEPIVDAAERRALVRALQAYDELGREVWAGWLGGENPEPDACPAGVRGLDHVGAGPRAASGG